MKKYSYNTITLGQFILLLHSVQVGVGILTLPRELAETSGTDGWMAIPIGWLLSSASSLLIVQLMKNNPDATVIDLLAIYFGKWVGKLAAVFIALYYTLGVFLVASAAIINIKVWILSQTPPWLIALLLAIPTFVIAKNGLRILARYAEVAFAISILLFSLLIFPLKESQFLNLLPLFKEGWVPILASVKTTLGSFLGFELVFLIYPFLENKKKASIGVIVANTMTMLVYVGITVICFVFFSPDEVTRHLWPTLDLLEVVEFRFLERVDIIFLTLYVLILSSTGIPFAYFAVFGSAQLLGKQNHKYPLIVFCILFVLTYYFYYPSYKQINAINDAYQNVLYGYAYILPLCLIVFAWCRKRLTGRK